MSNEKLVELKPCPFCGDQPYVVDDDSYGGCGIGCHCQAEPYIARTLGGLHEAIAAWNTRADALSATPAPGLVEVKAAADRLRAVVKPGGPDRLLLPSGAWLEGEGATAYLDLVKSVVKMLDRAAQLPDARRLGMEEALKLAAHRLNACAVDAIARGDKTASEWTDWANQALTAIREAAKEAGA